MQEVGGVNVKQLIAVAFSHIKDQQSQQANGSNVFISRLAFYQHTAKHHHHTHYRRKNNYVHSFVTRLNSFSFLASRLSRHMRGYFVPRFAPFGFAFSLIHLLSKLLYLTFREACQIGNFFCRKTFLF